MYIYFSSLFTTKRKEMKCGIPVPLNKLKLLIIELSSTLTDNTGFQVNKYCSWNVLACTSFGEKGVE